MIRKIFKLVIFGALGFLLYKGGEIYSTIKWATYVQKCANEFDLCGLGRRRASDSEIASAVTNLNSCVIELQPSFESLFFKVPKGLNFKSAEPIDYKYAEDFCRFK